MKIHRELTRNYKDLSAAQKKIISHLDGPLLVIAGPGSGKTFSLVLRAINLLLLEKATPRELVLCTFTEKAAFEMRDRVSAVARKVGYSGDLSELRVSTIHSLCSKILMEHRHQSPLGNNFETLDELTQLLFIFEHFEEIIGPEDQGLYLHKWKTRWTAISGVQPYFDKITEELLEVGELGLSKRPFLVALGKAYESYRKALVECNRVDFAHLQFWVHRLLQDPALAETVTKDMKYVLVDEYQDTNFIQEKLLLKLTEKTLNLCVVGDEDQSLYRFRGATVRNILEFPEQFSECKVVKLTTNYRSHSTIIQAYDRWMASADWSNPTGRPFRYDKKIEPDPSATYPSYPAVLAIWGSDAKDEAKRFADLVTFLKTSNVVEDYSQVALLLHSVRQDHSGHYLAALEAKGIPAFCPRARAYFENEEVILIVACFALIFGWHGDERGDVAGAVAHLGQYVDDGLVELAKQYSDKHPLGETLRKLVAEIAELSPGQTLDRRPADYFYHLLGVEPFVSYVKNENRARNLAIFSQLLNVFQNYYHYTVVTHRNRDYLRRHLFNSFLRLLYQGGMNEYEDKSQPLPKGYVQIMTIHQAKGLEFPVVVVSSLDKQLSSPKQVDRDLGPFYQRPPFEPESRITGFDRMRLHYVAFSRAEKVLVLTAHAEPKGYFAPIWEGLPQWPYVGKDLLAAQKFDLKERMPVKRAFSFTGDLTVYETCPRQYQFFREYDFTPSRSAVIFFGLLVHQTIEEIHRFVLDGQLASLKKPRIRQIFDRTFQFLTLSDVRPIGDKAREAAFQQVMNYFSQNKAEMERVIETEVDVSVEKDDYILTGKVDLLMGSDGSLELLDFKTSPRPADSPELLQGYEQQLCTYAHILERRYGKRVQRLLLYWTSEAKKKDALMEFPYRPELVEDAGRRFDKAVRKILAADFNIREFPDKGICKECDLGPYCVTDESEIRRAQASGKRRTRSAKK
ncbi:ATP-dependent helicase [Acidobacteriota bacterium]